MIFLSLILSSCNVYEYVEGKVNVVATTTMLGDLVNQLGGDKVNVTTLMGVGIDPHLYNPKAKDTTALLGSDLIVYNGFHLEGKMVDILDGLKTKKAVLDVSEAIEIEGYTLYQEESNIIDPHIWFDVRNWMVAANSLKNMLISLDEFNSEYYQMQYVNYFNQLNSLHQWILDSIEENLTDDQRVLVTAHDAFGYFGQAYRFEVAAIQGISTATEASIKDINDLIDLIIEKNVKAIFIESSVAAFTIEQVLNGAKARGHDVVIGKSLYSDSLGDGIYGTYIEAMRYNVTAIIEGLKGE